MRNFMQTRSYDIFKMFLNQFATAIFGFVLALAAGKAESPTLRNVTSAFAILFYLFLLYTMTWELAFKDKSSIDSGRKSLQPLTGLYMSLCANALNFLLALLITLATLFDVPFFATLGGIAAPIAIVLEGMFTGLLANHVGGVALNSYWWVYFLITIPSLITCTVAYLLGVKDIKFTGLFNVPLPESDRDPKKKK